MAGYHLTGSQLFYGQKDVKTYYNVSARKVWAGLRYMAQNFNLQTIFVYSAAGSIGANDFIGTYSKKYDNFREKNGGLSSNFKFI